MLISSPAAAEQPGCSFNPEPAATAFCSDGDGRQNAKTDELIAQLAKLVTVGIVSLTPSPLARG